METIYDESGVPIGCFLKRLDQAVGLLMVLPLIILALLITWGEDDE